MAPIDFATWVRVKAVPGANEPWRPRASDPRAAAVLSVPWLRRVSHGVAGRRESAAAEELPEFRLTFAGVPFVWLMTIPTLRAPATVFFPDTVDEEDFVASRDFAEGCRGFSSDTLPRAMSGSGEGQPRARDGGV